MQKELDEGVGAEDVPPGADTVNNNPVPEAQTADPGMESAESTGADPAAAEQPATESGASANAGELQRKLHEAESKIAEQWDQLVRARAESDNLAKRHKRELEAAHKFALEKFVAELLGVWDSLQLGLSHVQGDAGDLDKLREGTELTLKLLTDAMGKFGVEQVDPAGQLFDPELHQAMSMQPRDDLPPNTVVNVIQKGCTLNGRLVRPALVIVSQTGGGASGGSNLDTEA